MRRRDFLKAAVAAPVMLKYLAGRALAEETANALASPLCCGLTYPSPLVAMAAEPEKLAFVPAICVGTSPKRPDYLAIVDTDPQSQTYSSVIHRLAMPNVGDELHHYGWNTCSSCHGQPGKYRRYLVIPGFTSGNIHILDAVVPSRPKLHKVIPGSEIARKTNLSAPHTVHCGPDGKMIISMLGDAQGNGPGGFLVVDEKFKIAGRWEKQTRGMHYNYDFWYQPRHNVMVSSEWAAPATVSQGFKLDDVKAGKYGRRLCFWDWTGREIV